MTDSSSVFVTLFIGLRRPGPSEQVSGESEWSEPPQKRVNLSLVSLREDGISHSCPSLCVRQLLCRDWARGRGNERDILEEEGRKQGDQRKNQDRSKAVLERSGQHRPVLRRRGEAMQQTPGNT